MSNDYTQAKTVVILTQRFKPLIGGVSTFITEIADSLAKTECEIKVITEKNIERKSNSDYKVYEYPGFRKLPWWLSSIVRNIYMFFYLFFYSKGQRCDYIVSTWWLFGIYCYLMRLDYHICVHGSEILEPIKKGGFSARLMKKVLRNAKSILSNSNYTKEVVSDYIGLHRNISVVGCGINSPEKKETKVRNDKGDRFILSVGALTKRKGFDDLIRAFASSRYAIDEKLVIVGSGGQKDSLIKLVNELNIVDSVEFLSNISRNHLDTLFRTADVFVMLNKEVNGDYEGFGIVYIEAGKFGTPSIGCDSGGVPDAILHDQTGFLIQPNKPEEASKQLNILYENDEEWYRVSKNAITVVNNSYSWDNVAAKVKGTVFR